MSVFRTSEATTIGVKQRTTSKLFIYDNPFAFRYWRYVEGSAVSSHHPRVSRIIFTSREGASTNITTYTSDNCSDSGQYIIGTVSYDFGSKVEVVRAQIYATYAGLRASNYTVQYSADNSNWSTYFSGVMSNNSSCGISTGTGNLA